MSKTRMCRYECDTVLGDFDEKENKYREPRTGILHTKERCEFMKREHEKMRAAGTKKVAEETRPLTLEALDARLKRVEAMFNGGLQK